MTKLVTLGQAAVSLRGHVRRTMGPEYGISVDSGSGRLLIYGHGRSRVVLTVDEMESPEWRWNAVERLREVKAIWASPECAAG